MSDRTFVLLLAMTPGLGGKTVNRVLARNQLLGRAKEEFLALSPEAMREEYGLSPKSAEQLRADRQDGFRTILQIEEQLAGLNIKWYTPHDATYPAHMEEMDPDAPGVIFVYGNEKLLESRTFCVLTSRNALPADLDLMERLCEEAVLNSEVLVSGHDRATYQRSAVVPLRWGSPRILCLDRGFFAVLGKDLRQEAFRAARLWRYEFDPTTDLVISPFRPAADFIGVNNQVRDRIVGCLSRRLDFISIGDGGNMEKIAKMALRAGRSVRVSDRTIGYRQYEALGAQIIGS